MAASSLARLLPDDPAIVLARQVLPRPEEFEVQASPTAAAPLVTVGVKTQKQAQASRSGAADVNAVVIAASGCGKPKPTSASVAKPGVKAGAGPRTAVSKAKTAAAAKAAAAKAALAKAAPQSADGVDSSDEEAAVSSRGNKRPRVQHRELQPRKMSKAALKAAAKEAAEEARRQLEKRLTIGRRLEVGWLEKGDRNDDERSWYEGTIVDAEEHKTGRRKGTMTHRILYKGWEDCKTQFWHFLWSDDFPWRFTDEDADDDVPLAQLLTASEPASAPASEPAAPSHSAPSVDSRAEQEHSASSRPPSHELPPPSDECAECTPQQQGPTPSAPSSPLRQVASAPAEGVASAKETALAALAESEIELVRSSSLPAHHTVLLGHSPTQLVSEENPKGAEAEQHVRIRPLTCRS